MTTNYRLDNDSPAIDTGLTIPLLTVDLAGTSRPQGSGYDIGAFEMKNQEVYLPLIQK